MAVKRAATLAVGLWSLLAVVPVALAAELVESIVVQVVALVLAPGVVLAPAVELLAAESAQVQ